MRIIDETLHARNRALIPFIWHPQSRAFPYPAARIYYLVLYMMRDVERAFTASCKLQIFIEHDIYLGVVWIS